MKSKISVITQSYFGDHFYNTGWALLLSGIPVLVVKWYVGIIFVLLGIVLTSTVYKLVIDPSTKQIDDYLFFLGMRKGQVLKHYKELKHITIKSGRYTQQLQLRAASTTIEGTMYSAYLYTDEENFYLGESKNQRRITKKAKRIAEKLDIHFRDLKAEA